MKNPLNIVDAYKQANLASCYKPGSFNIAEARSTSLVELGKVFCEMMSDPQKIMQAFDPAEGVVRFTTMVEYWDKYIPALIAPAFNDNGLSGVLIIGETYDATTWRVTFVVPMLVEEILEQGN